MYQSTHTRAWTRFACTAAILGFSSSAWAQEEPAAAEAAPVDPAAEEAAPTSAPAEEPAKSADTGASADPEDGGGARFRWGISALGGPLLGGMSGGVGGVDVRFGAQIDDMIGIYGQPIALVGAGVNTSAGQFASASGLALAGVGALVDFTFADLFYAAIGPELLYGGLATGAVNGVARAEGGAFFSVASRLGIALGSMQPDRRKAFTMGLDMHIVIANDVVVAPMIALGYDAF